MGGVIQVDETDDEPQTSQQIHLQGPELTLNRRFVISVTDQQSRTDGGYLPEEKEPDEVIGKYDAEHGGQEKVDKERKIATPVLHFLMVLVIFGKVADCVQADGASDDADDQCHDDRKLVYEEAVLDLHRAA